MVQCLTPPFFYTRDCDLLIPIKANRPMTKSQCFCMQSALYSIMILVLIMPCKKCKSFTASAKELISSNIHQLHACMHPQVRPLMLNICLVHIYQ